jgi:hypothetical protein
MSFLMLQRESVIFLSGQDPIIGGPPPEKSPGVPKQAQYIGEAPTLTSGDQVDIRLTGGDGSNIEVSGFAKVTAPGTQPPPGEPNPFFVTSRGGEYFFMATGSDQLGFSGINRRLA